MVRELKQMNIKKLILLFAIVSLIIFDMPRLFAQDNGDFINLKRGMLWETINIAKIGPVFQNWDRKGYGMDYPGFDPEFLSRDVGGANTHHLGGGFWIGAQRPSANDSVWGVIDWAMFASSVGGSQVNNPYLLNEHRRRWPNGENFRMQLDPDEAEEVVDTEWELNPAYNYPYQPARFMPVRVKRTVRAWSGSARDEKYIIIEYLIKNIAREAHIFNGQNNNPDIMRVLEADSVLKNLTLLFTYSYSINERAWNILFPQYGNGARNNRFLYDPKRRLIYGWADDFSKEAGNEKFAPYTYLSGGPTGGKEWLAPTYAGLQFLYISPNKNGVENFVKEVGWSVSEPPSTYPLSGLESTRQRFEAMLDLSKTYQPILFPQGLADSRWNQSRFWTMASVGPWDLQPGDSIRIVTAEVVGSLSYEKAFSSKTTEKDIAGEGYADLLANADRAQFNYDHQYNVPDPPAAPEQFDLNHLSGQQVGNIIIWPADAEQIPDPDYADPVEKYDLAGYRIYRSQYLPFGPFKPIADISAGDPLYFDASLNTYTFIDTAVNVGFGYYYAISSYDSGHAYWPVDPQAVFPETGGNAVPPLESSYYPNHNTEPFLAAHSAVNETLDEIVVVPNPFVRRSGISTGGAEDIISFINVPSPCTLKIYTLTGDLVKTINHRENIGLIQWDQITDYGQFAESGVYIYHLQSDAFQSRGKTKIGKFAIVR